MSNDSRSLRILIVEDSELFALDVSREFREVLGAGYIQIKASRVQAQRLIEQEARRVAPTKEPFDVIVLDIDLASLRRPCPIEDTGVALAEWLRDESPCPHAIRIFCSGTADLAPYMKTGLVDACVYKHDGVAVLIKAVVDLLRQRGGWETNIALSGL